MATNPQADVNVHLTFGVGTSKARQQEIVDSIQSVLSRVANEWMNERTPEGDVDFSLVHWMHTDPSRGVELPEGQTCTAKMGGGSGSPDELCGELAVAQIDPHCGPDYRWWGCRLHTAKVNAGRLRQDPYERTIRFPMTIRYGYQVDAEATAGTKIEGAS